MKLVFKLITTISLILILAYFTSSFVLPSVTVINNSGQVIEQIQVTLPSSHLDFGSLNDSQSNTLHYALKQSDGTYIYQFTNTNSDLLTGSCGYVTQNEFHKKVVITINKNQQIVCN